MSHCCNLGGIDRALYKRSSEDELPLIRPDEPSTYQCIFTCFKSAAHAPQHAGMPSEGYIRLDKDHQASPATPGSNVLPVELAQPFIGIAAGLGMPPVMTYTAYVLINYMLKDPRGPLTRENLQSIFRFYELPDEEHFRQVHVCCEIAAAAAIRAAFTALEAARSGDRAVVLTSLKAMQVGITEIMVEMGKMRKGCDPKVFFQPIRIPLGGWPERMGGVIFKGVPGMPEPYISGGASGTQTTTIPVLDAALGIGHVDGNAEFMADQDGGNLQTFAMSTKDSHIINAYAACVDAMHGFRKAHQAFVSTYILRQMPSAEQSQPAAPQGTGDRALLGS
ncbi:hypothetical protein WJX84_003051 [Apatococcus fuscideae]|uniref:Uncharacterized protein n=1 Tax=Apatococcus fuscideae TaxID=2026836 RepID=A0AAW1SUP7_9CHLO